MAAVAVAGAASAQVSITGSLGYGWETKSQGNGPSTKGLKVTDGNVKFSATEDLGGGMSVATAMDIQSRGRGTDIAGRDASITLVTGAGGFTLGAVEAGNGILGLGGAGAPTIGLDGNAPATFGPILTLVPTSDTTGSVAVSQGTRNEGVLDSASNVNIAQYSLPVGNAFGISIARIDDTATGEGVNPGNVYGATYAMAGLNAKIDVTQTKLADRTRISGSYDLGVATIGAGYQTRKPNNATAEALLGKGTNKQTIIGVAMPVGALTVGLNYATNKNADDIGANGKGLSNKGTDIGVSYALSKRTALYAQMQRVTVGTAEATTTTRFKLKTSF
jgi:predicted porin